MLNKSLKREEYASRFINIAAHYDDETLIDKSGKLIKIIKLSGLDFVTQSQVTLNQFKNYRNNLFKQFSSEFALYFWSIRKRWHDYPAGEFQNKYADQINQYYKEKILQKNMFHAELYLAVMTKQPEGIINKGLSAFKQLTIKMDKSAKAVYLQKRHQELCEATRGILSTLNEYNPVLLRVYEKNSIQFSEPLEFLSQLLNNEKYAIPVEEHHADSSLVNKRIFFNHHSGNIEIRSNDHRKKFAACLAIKSYSPHTYAGMLDILNQLKIEFVMTQSFRFYDRHLAKTKLRDQQKDMMQVKDESIRQTSQIDEAVDETASGELGYGLHHFTLFCYADSQEALNQNIASVTAQLTDLDIVCIREDIASECSFWAQLPGNFGFIVRSATISTKNMASLASLNNDHLGKKSHNHWGDAVSVLETISGSPYYFNFHYKDVGNFLVFGSMGSGKTVLVGFLIAQSMKFGGKRIIFDKDRGLDILVRALGGQYSIIKPGVATGFNPCQLTDTPENRQFLVMLLRKILACQESDIAVLKDAIEGLYRLAPHERQFCHLASFLGAKKPNSLRAAFDQWHSDGTYAWVFDHHEDRLNLNPDLLGFDLSHILSDERCKTPMLMYLTHRVNQTLAGERGMLFCDEGWLALNDDYFRNLIDDWSRTPRKKNNFFGLATQVANDTVHSSINKSLAESAFCKVFYPNPSADAEVYQGTYGLTDHEYHLVKTLPDDQFYFLLVHGRGANKQSVVARVNLQGMEDFIAVASAREETLKVLDELLVEFGDDSVQWLPEFHKRRKQI